MNEDKPHKSKLLQKLLNIECLCIHFWSVLEINTGFWFTGGIFEESSPVEGTPLLLGFSPVSSPSRPDLVMHRVDMQVSWFLGQLGGYAGRFSISGEQTLMPIPKN